MVMRIKEVKPRDEDDDERTDPRPGAAGFLAALAVPLVIAVGAGFVAGVAGAAAYWTFRLLTSF